MLYSNLQLETIVVFIFLVVSYVEVRGQDTTKRPNIIIIQPDDFLFFDEWDSPPNNPNKPKRKMNLPRAGLHNIERLRKNGLQMMQAYAASPMCGTSRFTTITGKYATHSAYGRAKATRNNAAKASVIIPNTKLEDVDGMNDCSEDNVAATFKRNGYHTAMVGKWHLSDIKSSDYNYNSAIETIKRCGFAHVGGLYVENLWYFDDYYKDETFTHNMEWVTREAIDFIESSDDEPFFLYFNPTIPHSAHSVTDALKYSDCRDTPNGKLNSDIIIKGMTKEYGGSCKKYRESIFERGESEDDYGAIWLDDGVGALLTALEEKNALEHTIILFQNDHGMNAKASLYEGGLRIPQFVHYPSEYEPGTKFHGLVSTIDIGATMLDFAGIQPGYEFDGISWKDAIGNNTLEDDWKHNRCLFFEHQRDRAARCGCDKYLQIYKRIGSGTYRNGFRNGYSNSLINLFDLCDGGKDYVTDNASNMESNGLNHRWDQPEKAALISATMECHDIKTNWKHPPNFKPTKRNALNCVDSPLPMHPHGRTCDYFNTRPKLCEKEHIAKHCPLTCNACSKFKCSDSIQGFDLAGGSKRSCEGLGMKNDLAFMCNIEGVAETCREKCKYCSTNQCTKK